MKKLSLHVLYMALVATLFPACQKFEEYPIEPHIEYQDFAVVKDSIGRDSLGFFTISYRDGDGDIGLTKNDTLPPYQYNFFLNIYENINGELVKLQLPDTNVNFNSRIPVLTPDGINKAIKGSIEMKLELFMMTPFLNSDTIAFEAWIVDRALHKSNVVMSPQFILK